MATHAQRLAAFAERFAYDDMPAEATARAKRRMLDILGIGLAASDLDDARLIVETAPDEFRLLLLGAAARPRHPQKAFFSKGVFLWPALAQAFYVSAPSMRLTRSQMLEVIREDDIRKARKDLIYKASEPGSISQLHMNATKPPFDNPDMRRGVNLAIDRHEIMQKAYDGAIIPCVILPQEAFGDDALPAAEALNAPGCRQPKDEDLAEAKKLVAKHYPKGIDIEVAVRSVGNYVDIASLVIQQLKQIGIRGKLKTWESAAGFAAWARGDFTLIGAQATALTFMDPSALFTTMTFG